MRALPAGLQDHLDSGTTTMCWCWKLQTNDGRKFGFTDHDNDLTFDAITFEAASGFTGSEVETGLGLAVDNLDVEGALSSLKLNEQDLFAGVFDNAEVEIWQVNWAKVSQRLLIKKGNLGEVSRNDSGFSAEIRGMSHLLNQPQGRLFQRKCDTDLGSQRCGVDLSSPAYRQTGQVTEIIESNKCIVSGLDGFSDGWFAAGRLQFSSGNNLDRASEIKNFQVITSGVVIELWAQMPVAIEVGDDFIVTAGCDKDFKTCKGKFANSINFQGFPHMPGNDFVAFYPNRRDGKNDGSAFN